GRRARAGNQPVGVVVARFELAEDFGGKVAGLLHLGNEARARLGDAAARIVAAARVGGRTATAVFCALAAPPLLHVGAHDARSALAEVALALLDRLQQTLGRMTLGGVHESADVRVRE